MTGNKPSQMVIPIDSRIIEGELQRTQHYSILQCLQEKVCESIKNIHKRILSIFSLAKYLAVLGRFHIIHYVDSALQKQQRIIEL
jgi:hypothetical protein